MGGTVNGIYRTRCNYQINLSYLQLHHTEDTRSGHPRAHKTRLLIVIFVLFGTCSALIARVHRQFTVAVRKQLNFSHFAAKRASVFRPFRIFHTWPLAYRTLGQILLNIHTFLKAEVQIR